MTIKAQSPIFYNNLSSVILVQGHYNKELNGTAYVTDGGTLTYQWQSSTNGVSWNDISGATLSTYYPPTKQLGIMYYRVNVTNTAEFPITPSNTLYPSDVLYPNALVTYISHSTSNIAVVRVVSAYSNYFDNLRQPYTKLCRLRFLQSDGSTAFAVDNNVNNRRSGAFIQDGSITCNLQNGQRRTVTVTLSNLDGEFDYNINHIWFGQQIALDEGLILSDGTEYYLPQGIFYIKEPQEILMPNERTMTFPLVDKWAYLDGTLFGTLDSTYVVNVGTNIFAPIQTILSTDKGNGYAIDNVKPIFTNYYNDKTQKLTDGTTASMILSPYTLRIDSNSGTYADVISGLATMINAWIGYDANGALRIDPSQDDISDLTKPILWEFGMDEVTFLGATYTMKNTDVYNDYVVLGEQISTYNQAAGRAENLDPASPTNINLIGRRTYREDAAGYATDTQCADYAAWQLKRSAVLQKSVTISCSQLFHIDVNDLVTIKRTDKQGSPVERHLIQGFTRPLTSTGEMTINCTSVEDYPNATITKYGG